MRAALFLVVALAALLSMVPPAHAQVGISPQILELRLDQPAQVHMFRLHNFDARERDVAVSVATWTLDEKGEVVILPPSELSLDRWVIISPLKFRLKANSVQTVRVAVRPPVALAAGEHRAMVYFDEVLPPPAEGEGMRGRFQIGAAIYAYQGEPQRAGRIEGLALKGKRLTATLTSTGTSHVRLGGFYGIWNADAFPGLEASPLAGLAEVPKANKYPEGLVSANALPSLPVLPAGTRPVSAELPELAPGRYIVEVHASLSGQPHPPQTFALTIPARAPGR